MKLPQSIAGKGFGFDRLSKAEIEELQAKFSAITCGNCVTATRRWSPQKIKTVMGMLNILIYRAAKEANLLIHVKKAMHFKNFIQKGYHKVVDNAIAIASRKVKEFRCGMKTVGMYLRKFWEGTSSGKTTLWKFKNMLAEEFGLFRLEERQFVPGVFGKATVITEFDLQRSLVLYEHLENLLMRYAEEKENFDEMLPEHNGTIVVLLFNRIFHGVAGYRRETCEETVRQQYGRKYTEEEALKERDQFVKPRYIKIYPGRFYIHGWKSASDGRPITVALVREDNGEIITVKERARLLRIEPKFTRTQPRYDDFVPEFTPNIELPY